MRRGLAAPIGPPTCKACGALLTAARRGCLDAATSARQDGRAGRQVDKYPSRERQSAVALEPRVSAIVVVRNVQSVGAQHALDLSLRAALAEPWIDDLVIVDAGNAPGISSSLRALHMDRRDVKLVSAPLGASAGAAANLGAGQARGRWLLFLAPDIVLQRGAAERLAAAGGS